MREPQKRCSPNCLVTLLAPSCDISDGKRKKTQSSSKFHAIVAIQMTIVRPGTSRFPMLAAFIRSRGIRNDAWHAGGVIIKCE